MRFLYLLFGSSYSGFVLFILFVFLCFYLILFFAILCLDAYFYFNEREEGVDLGGSELEGI